MKNFFFGGGAFWATLKNFSWALWATLESEIGAFVARNIGNTGADISEVYSTEVKVC